MTSPLFNPFPGLRPFEPDEDHLFFGREKETDGLLRRLRSHRFLAVVGTSGSGKSSLVRSGLIPALYSGFMAGAGSSWRISLIRPGEDPIGHLAEGLDAPSVLGDPEATLASTNRVLLDATLRRGTLGLVDAIRLARIPAHDNVLILVDQFEELFRFRKSRQTENSRDEAVAFVKLLLEAANQTEIPIFVVLTMRSDFIGDCMEYPGLPEAVNEGQYLVPRLTRDELRSAITGPVAVAGGAIAPRLVARVLNDVGDDQDQLPLVQHVLMRTWNHWIEHRRGDQPMDLVDYEAVGTLRHALSNHAEEAFEETGTESNKRLTERLFKALTDTYTDPRGIRRPTSIADLAAICEAPEAQIIEIVDIFRRAGRSFLMPPPTTPLASSVIVDLSHESLMRCWTRLIAWAQEERTAAAIYSRLSREAAWHKEGAASLWSDPELEIGLRWRRDSHPTAAWAKRYDAEFDRAMQFLDLSEQERDRERDERRRRRIRRLQVAWGSAGVLLVVTIMVAYLAKTAAYQRSQAETNLRVANKAVNESLAATDRDPTLVASEPPETQALRRELLEKAKAFYEGFVTQAPRNEEFLKERADAYFRLGHIYRVQGSPAQAEREYNAAIAEFESLAKTYGAKPEYRQSLANSHNWMGETLRPIKERRQDAEAAYQRALGLQTTLVAESPSSVTYKQELARTYYNRGILYSNDVGVVDDPAFRRAEADFREAIRVLQPLEAAEKSDRRLQQDLARATNNLASLLDQDQGNARRLTEARDLYRHAIEIHRGLIKIEPANREYKLELAKFLDNLAYLLGELGDLDEAAQTSTQALALMDELALPSAALGIEHADAHNLRARILQSKHSNAAASVYRESLALYQEIEPVLDRGNPSEFHRRFPELLLNLASLRQEQPKNEDGLRVLADALAFYLARGQKSLAAGFVAEAQTVVANLSDVVRQLAERDRRVIAAPLKELQAAVDKQVSKRK